MASPFNIVSSSMSKYSPVFDYADESDKGPYPIPSGVKIEGVLSDGPNVDGDRHILCIDPTAHKLYELYYSWFKNGRWQCGSGAIFDLTKRGYGQRPLGWTSADAAGLPIFPGLARYDEICIKKHGRNVSFAGMND